MNGPINLIETTWVETTQTIGIQLEGRSHLITVPKRQLQIRQRIVKAGFSGEGGPAILFITDEWGPWMYVN